MASKGKLGDQLRAAIKGLKTAIPEGTASVTVGGEAFTVRQILTTLESFERPWATADDLGEQFHAAVEVRDGGVPASREFLAELTTALRALLGRRNPELKKFGIQPYKTPARLTSDERAAATAKSRATRKAHEA